MYFELFYFEEFELHSIATPYICSTTLLFGVLYNNLRHIYGNSLN